MENNQVQVFNNVEFGDIRVIMQGEQPWFVGKDVASMLGYSNARQALKTNVEEEDKMILQKSSELTLDIPNRGVTIINESGLYSLIMSSKLPSAKQFKHWVTSDILPTIRQHGAYLTPEKVEEVLMNPDTIIKLATQLKAEREGRIKAEAALKAATPKVEYYDEYMNREETFTVTFVANTLAMGQHQLYKKLREIGWLCKPYGCSHQVTEYAPEDVFKIVPVLHTGGGKGSQIRVTAKGMKKIQSLFDK
nr:MAG TPA: repressor domain protein [Caudoviricetes sp.]